MSIALRGPMPVSPPERLRCIDAALDAVPAFHLAVTGRARVASTHPVPGPSPARP
jgi:hypothetical protein